MFASEYGWSKVEIFSQTLFQLRRQQDQIVERQYTERHFITCAIRAAHHAKNNQFQSFINSLKPSSKLKKKKGSAGSKAESQDPYTPSTGFSVTQE